MPYPPVRHKSRRQARRATMVTAISAIIAVLLLISVVIFVSRCASGAFTGDDTTDDSTTPPIDSTTPYEDTEPGESTSADTTPEDTTTAETEPQLDPNYEYIIKTEEEIHRGYQLLINHDYAYDFTGLPTMTTLYANKSGVFKVSNTNDSLDVTAMSAFVDMMKAFKAETGNHDIIVTSSNRTLEYQQGIWNDYVDTYGEEYARLYVAIPGHSEHHAGLALDLAIYTDKGETYKFDDKPEYPEWLSKNAYRFGYIERYKADKTDITKIAYENWHYRYVGKPHAYYMSENNLCLEEYIEKLKTFKFGENHLTFTDNEGTPWEIYYYPAEIFGDTEVPVPTAGNYEISGNNADGFIITVKK